MAESGELFCDLNYRRHIGEGILPIRDFFYSRRETKKDVIFIHLYLFEKVFSDETWIETFLIYFIKNFIRWEVYF